VVFRLACRLFVYTNHPRSEQALRLFPAFGQSVLNQPLTWMFLMAFGLLAKKKAEINVSALHSLKYDLIACVSKELKSTF